MPNYVKTGIFTNGSAPGISASFLNNIENVFVQPSSGSETGHYRLAGNAYTTGAVVSHWVNSLSRGATPTGASIDTADSAPNVLNAPTAANWNVGGFLIFSTSTGTNGNCNCAGNWTLSY